MGESTRIVTVDASNLDEHGFFCFKSRRGSEGYVNKQKWLLDRFSEGMKIVLVYEGKRSVGFIEYIPGEYTWRAVDAPEHLVIHCLWVIGRAKKKGFGSKLLAECVDDARERGKAGVAMVASPKNWLANPKVFQKHGFESVDEAPPSFYLMVKSLGPGPSPRFAVNWQERCESFGPGTTIVSSDQCPYHADAVQRAVTAFADRGIDARVVHLENCAQARSMSPTPYGVFWIICNGRLLSYHYLGRKEIKILDDQFLSVR